ncbi:MAG TPA: alpha-galactosidase [Candidatus Bathyarchaeia archaeon]|nr:alpha-galactosidase [Candidatus Bathyarchaeia archaeon]
MFSAVLILAAAAASQPVPQPDWLVAPCKQEARLKEIDRGQTFEMSNGLVRRTFRVHPNFATVGLDNLCSGASVLRGVKPEAVVELDGARFEVGGLKGQPDYAYLDRAWVDAMTSAAAAFQYAGHSVGKPDAPFEWEPARHASSTVWPPRGVSLKVDFVPSEAMKEKCGGIRVSIIYELYDGIPVMTKRVVVANDGPVERVVTGLSTELLAVNEQEKARLGVESDYAFNTMVTTQWGPDAEYLTQVDYNYQMPLLMTSRYPTGPGVRLKPGGSFESFRTFELFHDSDDRERRGLARRRMMRALAPHATENPIFMHVRKSDSASVRRAIDQCAETGFEMVIMTFWSGFDIESEDPVYIARVKSDVDYAHGKGIELGGYTLMTASRDISPEFNCIGADGKPSSMFGQSVCLASEWSDGYFRRVLNFIDSTGLDMIETDGPYHGDVCHSTVHKYHEGLADSQLRQWERCAWFYRECRKRGVYINSPDNYYFNGSNKCAMGYRETNFSLPRERQILISRQNIYDGTFEKTASMGWMFVPLTEYHGGGAAATFEPLCEHLDDYEWHLAQNFGCGVQACYRGPRLYDTDETRGVVAKWAGFYKTHRTILDSDLIHVRRADGRGIDCMMHVRNPEPDDPDRTRALVMVFNPTLKKQRERLRLPLYYTGLTETARVQEQDGRGRTVEIDRDYSIEIPVRMKPKSITWFVVE